MTRPEKVKEFRTVAGADLWLASAPLGDGLRQNDISVPGAHCGGCIRKIEGAVGKLPGVSTARLNLSTKRLNVRWTDGGDAPPIMETLQSLGFEANLNEPEAGENDRTLKDLVRSLAVAGFAAGNIMMLSVAVWAGAGADARQIMHWLSAAIALPTLAYAGRIFYRSAARALRHGRTNMDVPITLGIILAFGLSLYDTLQGDQHAYFDASVTLLFFLLIGRTLDHMMREKARTAVKGLAKLAPRTATRIEPDGSQETIAVGEIEPGMRLLIAAGDRLPVNGRIVSGRSDLDCSLVSGESLPQPVLPGSAVQAGMLNLTGALTIEVTAAARDSFLADMMRLMERAEAGRSGYRRIADKAAQLYVPVVHGAAFLSFAGWMFMGPGLHEAVTVAVSVLIITCPCALGLAVPMVQVVAARRLMEAGILMKDGAALERLAEADTVVFDKTGTLTMGAPDLLNASEIEPGTLSLAASLAAFSRHPYAKALAASAQGGTAFDEVREVPGEGLEARLGGDTLRLGRAGWAMEDKNQVSGSSDSETILSRNGECLARFRFADRPREGAADAVAALKARGLPMHILSGDREQPVRELGAALGIDTLSAGQRPEDKTKYLEALAGEGRHVLMVGDGLNDAPALAAAHISMAPGAAADIGRNAADFVFLKDSPEAVPAALDLAQAANRRIRENFALAILYNAIALPLAVLGIVTPLIAAIAMSSSSILVVANALRLSRPGSQRKAPAPQAAGLTSVARAKAAQ